MVHIASMIRLQLLNSVENVSSGDANANDGFHSIQIRNCQNPSTIAIASSFGQAVFQIAPPQRHLRRDRDFERVETRE